MSGLLIKYKLAVQRAHTSKQGLGSTVHTLYSNVWQDNSVVCSFFICVNGAGIFRSQCADDFDGFCYKKEK